MSVGYQLGYRGIYLTSFKWLIANQGPDPQPDIRLANTQAKYPIIIVWYQDFGQLGKTDKV